MTPATASPSLAPRSQHGKKLGILLSTSPRHPAFRHGINLASAALDAGVTVYLYCIDEAVSGVAHENLQALRSRGLNLFACAYAAQQRHLPTSDLAVYSGLGMVSDLIVNTDRFVSFN